MTDTQRSSTRPNLRIRLAVILVIVASATAYQLRTMAKKTPTFESSESPALSATIGVAPQEIQTITEHTIQTFLEDLRSQNYEHALKATAREFPTPHSIDGLKLLVRKEAFSPILSAALKFDSAHLGSHNQKVILRASLQANGKPYRTVCSLVNQNGNWLISGILDPVPPSKPPIMQSSGQAKSR